MKQDIGSMIRQLRKTCGMSQMKLADKIGVSYQQVQKYEKGASKLSVHRLLQIAEVFQVPPESFLHGNATDPESLKQPPESVLAEDEMVIVLLFRRLRRKKLKDAFTEMIKDIIKIVEWK